VTLVAGYVARKTRLDRQSIAHSMHVLTLSPTGKNFPLMW
jgi:hypothetical protein